MLICDIVEAIIITIWAWIGVVSTDIAVEFYNTTAVWANSTFGCFIPY